MSVGCPEERTQKRGSPEVGPSLACQLFRECVRPIKGRGGELINLLFCRSSFACACLSNRFTQTCLILLLSLPGDLINPCWPFPGQPQFRAFAGFGPGLPGPGGASHFTHFAAQQALAAAAAAGPGGDPLPAQLAAAQAAAQNARAGQDLLLRNHNSNGSVGDCDTNVVPPGMPKSGASLFGMDLTNLGGSLGPNLSALSVNSQLTNLGLLPPAAGLTTSSSSLPNLPTLSAAAGTQPGAAPALPNATNKSTTPVRLLATNPVNPSLATNGSTNATPTNSTSSAVSPPAAPTPADWQMTACDLAKSQADHWAFQTAVVMANLPNLPWRQGEFGCGRIPFSANCGPRLFLLCHFAGGLCALINLHAAL